MSLQSFQPYALLVLGIVLSAILAISFPESYHHYDMSAFWKWSQYWSESWRAIYINCDTCNYPIMGMLSSAGLLSLLGILFNSDFHDTVFVFRLLLGLIDGGNVLLMFWLLKQLSIKHSAFWAGIVGILPSSWAGGALWGQIDGVSQCSILITVGWIVRMNKKAPPGKTTFAVYLAISSVMLSWIILTKQLTLFSCVPLGLLLTTNIFFFSRKWSERIAYALLMMVTFVVSNVVWDSFLSLREPYVSHLYYIWKTGSTQGGIISGNGFNVWMFLGRNMSSSSDIAIFNNSLTKSHIVLSITPYIAGVVLFAVFNSLTTLSLLLFARKHFMGVEQFLNVDILSSFIFLLALVNLSFNVFLAGTHERYLYHFYPFIIVACLGLRKQNLLFSNYLICEVILGSILYGSFVLGILAGRFNSIGYIPHWILGLFHVGLLCSLLMVFLNHHEFNENVRWIASRTRRPFSRR